MAKLDFLKKIRNMNRNTILVCVAVVAILITGGLIYANSNPGFALPSLFGPSDAQIAKKAVDYINNNQLASTPASLVKVSETQGLVKITLKIGTSQFDSYATKDGKLFFPQGLDMSGKTADSKTTADSSAGKTADQIIAAIKKTDKPSLEAFVVSSCPFGLQMQRMVAAAVKSVPDLASSVKIRYIGSISNGKVVSMHDGNPGGGEATENLRQICIREEQPAKFLPYLSCYMQKASGQLPNGMPLGDSKACLSSTGVDLAKVNSCMTTASRGLAYAQKDFDLATKYNVSGSPTLILNGTEVAEFTSDNKPVFGSGRSADELKTIMCDVSKTKPSFCSAKLDQTQAATSFSLSYAGSGSSSSAANCAAPQ